MESLAPSSPPPVVAPAPPKLASIRAHLRATFIPPACPPEQRGLLRRAQVTQMAHAGPAATAGSTLNVTLFLWTMWGTITPAWLLAWSMLVVVLSSQTLVLWHKTRSGVLRPHSSQRTERAITLHAAATGALWGAVPALMLPAASADQVLFGWIMTGGMLGAANFCIGSMPKAGTAYCLAIFLGSAVGVLRTPFEYQTAIAVMLVLYTSTVLMSVWIGAVTFNARHLAAQQASQRSEVIGLLLRDFESQSSDLLWEIDAQGMLVAPSARLADKLGADLAQLRSTPLAATLDRIEHRIAEQADQGVTALRRRLREAQPFRDHVIALQLPGQRTAWWSLSATPVRSSQGRITGWRGVASDVTRVEQARRELTHMAHCDALTGLTNRRQFHALLKSLLDTSGGKAVQPFAVMGINVEQFKTINETLGHAAGDAVLTKLAERLRRATRNGDVVARVAGDEFAIVLVGAADEADVEPLAARVRKLLHAPLEWRGKRIELRTRIGVAFAPRDGAQFETLIGAADLALFHARTARVEGVVHFNDSIGQSYRRRQRIEQGLREALRHHALHLAYQPQIGLKGDVLRGFEALLRWRDAELGDVSPVEFIPVAESCGLMSQVGEHVLRRACAEATRWPEGIAVSVNVSPAQLGDASFERVVLRALEDSGLAASRLELEITESIFLSPDRDVTATLARLRERGIRIALDDFGTGYSSLAYLRQFPFDTLKIDRSFIRELMTRGDASAIVRTIVELSQTLRMETVAEGVEEEAEKHLLRELGCEIIQGFLIAQPMPQAEVDAFIAQWPSLPAIRPHGDGSPVVAVSAAGELSVPSPLDP